MKRIWRFVVLIPFLALGSWLLVGLRSSAGVNRAPALGTPVCNTISSNTTWAVISSPIVVCGPFGVSVAQGVTLTIQPGVAVQFQSNSSLVAYGTVLALGTAQAPITFTGAITSPGSWQGVTVNGSVTQTNHSAFNYVTFEYGGQNIGGGAQLTLSRARVSVTHSLFRSGAGHGIYGETQGVADVSESTFLGNGGYAIYFFDGTVNPVLGHLVATGNGTNAVGIDGVAYLQGAHVWEFTGLPYVITRGVVVVQGSTLMIDPGVEVQFMPNTGLTVNGGLTAVGLPSSPITLTGTTRAPGAWLGLEVLGNTRAPGVAQLEYVTLEYGGIGTAGANLYLANGQVAMRHGIIRNGGHDGVQVAQSGVESSILQSQIISNAAYAVRNLTPQVPVMATNNWWGNPTGPAPDSGCTTGTGGPVSTGVFFRPVLTDVNAAPAPLPLSQADSVSMTPRRWFAPADNISRIYFDLTVRDGNGAPLPNRVVHVSSSLGSVSSLGFTDSSGKMLAFVSAATPGDANVSASIQSINSCEDTAVATSKVTFTPPLSTTDLLPNGEAPYVNTNMQFSPLPVVQGVTDTFTARLTNPFTVPITVDASLEFAQFGIGLVFGPLGTYTGVVIPPLGTTTLVQSWLPLISGHYCVQVRYAVTGIGKAVRVAAAEDPIAQDNTTTHSGRAESQNEKDILNKTQNSLNGTKQFVQATYSPNPFAIPLYLVSFNTTWMVNMAQNLTQELMGDPPRQDYMQLTSPVKRSVTPLQPNAQVSITRTNAINAMNDSLLQFNADAAAAQTALDRYGGASEAGNLQWASVQMAAFQDYKQMAGTDAFTVSQRISDVLGIAASEGVTSVVVSVGQVISMQQVLSATGFTTAQIDDAHSVGLTDTQIEATRQSIITGDPNEMAGDVVVQLKAIRDNMNELYWAVQTPQIFAPPLVVGGSAGLASANTAAGGPPVIRNTMAQVFAVTETVQLANPLTQTAIIDVVARRVDLPSDWLVVVAPAQVTLASGKVTSVTVSIIPGAPVPQGSMPRVAIEGYTGNTLLGGVTIGVMVPNYVYFDGHLHTYLPAVAR